MSKITNSMNALPWFKFWTGNLKSKTDALLKASGMTFAVHRNALRTPAGPEVGNCCPRNMAELLFCSSAMFHYG